MADQKNVTLTYDIVDENGSKTDANGNPYGVRQYSGVVDENGNPQGGSLFVDAYNAKKSGGNAPRVYQDPDDSELWTSEYDANVSIDVITDGETADIVISGPEWYANQVKESDWFKDNYDNKAFRRLVEMYVNNPTGAVIDPTDDSKTITYEELFNRYAEAFGETAGAYKELAKFKSIMEGIYGTQLSDSQAMIAGTTYDKSDYNKNGAVYIPKWMSDKRDMTKYGSWDPDSRTMSADDFFTNFYSTANWDANGIRELKDLGRRAMQNQAMYAACNKEDRELRSRLKDEDYKDEVARTYSIMSIMTKNDAESDFGMDMVMFGTGVLGGFLDGVTNFVSGLGQTLTSIFEMPMVFSDTPLVIGAPVGAVAYTALSVLGELFEAGVSGQWDKFGEEFNEDLSKMGDTLDDDNAWTKFRKDYQAGMDKFWQGAGDLSKSVEAGKFIGGVIYKIVENLVLLNAVGGAVGNAISGGTTAATATVAGAAEQTATTLAVEAGAKATGFFGTQGLSTMFKVLTSAGNTGPASAFLATSGLIANAGVQGVIETLVDDSDTFNALLATGDTKVIEVLFTNVGYNAMGEFMGWGATKVGNTTAGKIVSGGAKKVTNAVAEKRYNALHWMMEKIYKNSDNLKTQSKMAFVAEEAKLTGEIADMPILKGAKELGLKEAVSKNYAEMQAKINARIAVENAYDAMNASIKQGMFKTQSELDADTVKKFYADAEATFKVDAEYVSAGKLTKSAAPGSKLSQEASDYLSYTQRSIRLTNKMAKQGGKLSAEEASDLELTTAKLTGLRAKLGNEYATQLDGFYNSIAKYQQQLNFYKLNNQLFTDPNELAKQLELMDESSPRGFYGKDGEKYIHTERYFEGENYAENFLKNKKPTKGRTATPGKGLGENIEEHFVDPTTMLMLDLSKTASLKVQTDWQTALAQAHGMDKNVVATAEEKVLSDNFARMREQNLASFTVDSKGKSGLSQTIRDAFDSNDLFQKAYTRTTVAKKTAIKAKNDVERGYANAEKKLKLNDTGVVERTVWTFKPEDIAEINATLPKNKIPDFNFSRMTAEEFNTWYGKLSKYQKAFLDYTMKDANLNVNVTNVRNLMRKPGYEWVRTGLQQRYILDTPKIRNTKAFIDKLYAQRAEKLTKNQLLYLRDNIVRAEEGEAILKAGDVKFSKKGPTVKNPNAITGEYGRAYTESIENTVEDIIKAMRGAIESNESSMLIVKNMMDAGVDETNAIRYVTLHNLKNITKGDIKTAISAKDFASKELKAATKNGHIDLTTYQNYVTNQSDAIYKMIQTEYDESLRGMLNGKFGGVIDPGEAYARVEQYIGDIGAKVAANDVVAYPDVANRTIKYVKVDPVVADLYNLRPGSFNLTMDDYGTGAQHVIGFFNRLNRLFQWGTTGFSLTSFVNQWWRDSYNAVLVGGARPFLDFGIGAEVAPGLLGKKVAGRMTDGYIDRYGKQTMEYLKSSLSEEQWASFTKAANDAGLSLEEASVRQVVGTTGYKMLPGQEKLTTVGYYLGGETGAKFQGRANDLQEELINNVGTRKSSLFSKNGVKEAESKIDKVINWVSQKQWGSWREMTLRQNVYASAYGRALDAGMCVSDAQQYATRFALDATTDFARPILIGDSIAKSVPYFGAAINGVESFYRLMEIDPAGVAGRFIGGLVLPTMSAVGKTLSDEENRKIYMNIPEYDKEDALVFVYNGEVISIPLPQEISGFLALPRQMVEKAHEANDKSWLDLISADILGIAPVDLSGFVDLDYNELLGDPTFGDRIARGTEKAISTLMPAAAKAAYKYVTRRDPYTGKSIDRSYTYVDDDGNIQIMDSTQSEFAQWFSKQPFSLGLTASSAASIFKDILGRAGMNIANAITKTVTSGVGDGAKLLATRAGEGALGVMTPDVYNKARNEWYDAVRSLEAEKAAIQGDKTYLSLQQKISFETDPEKLKAMYAESDEYVYKFQKKVCDIVDGLKKKYPGMYNGPRQAAVIALLNMNSGIAGAKSGYARGLSKELYYQGRQNAVATMQAFGFTSVQDRSILGYGKIKSDGEYEFVYNDPLVIMNMGNILYGQASVNKANIESILEVNKLTRSEMYGDEWNMLQTKAEKKAYKQAWNKRVITVLAPYITRHGVEAVLSDYETRDLLDNYIFVDNPYKTKDYLYQIFGGK